MVRENRRQPRGCQDFHVPYGGKKTVKTVWFLMVKGYITAAGNRLRKCTIIDASNSASSVNSSNPKKYWAYGFSFMYVSVPRSVSPSCSLIYIEPNAIRAGIGVALFPSEKFSAYFLSIISQGMIPASFTHRFCTSKRPLNGKRNPSMPICPLHCVLYISIAPFCRFFLFLSLLYHICSVFSCVYAAFGCSADPK